MEFLFLFRERLIHLLALKPYKKPELYDRISRGITTTCYYLFYSFICSLKIIPSWRNLGVFDFGL